MGHSSIQVTVDIYGHLIPGADVSFVDRLDQLAEGPRKTTPQQNATQAQLPENGGSDIPVQATDLIGGGGWTRTNDLRIMRSQAGSEPSGKFSTLLLFPTVYKSVDLIRSA